MPGVPNRGGRWGGQAVVVFLLLLLVMSSAEVIGQVRNAPPGGPPDAGGSPVPPGAAAPELRNRPSPDGTASLRTGAQPAPMGVADLSTNRLTTSRFVGNVAIGGLATYNASLGSSAFAFSLQLNAFLVFTVNGTEYSYWSQSVAVLDSGSRSVSFLDNVWNVTSENLTPSAVAGNGTVSGTGANAYYGYAPPCTMVGACRVLPDPATLGLALAASIGGGGTPTVRFQFNDTGALVTFDTVSFPFAHSGVDLVGFEVDPGLGIPSFCARCWGDAELVAGGPGGGADTAIAGPTQLTFSLRYWNGHNLAAIPDASNHGEATEEGISGVQVGRGNDSLGEPVALLSDGTPSPFADLWSAASTARLELTDWTGSTHGNLSLDGASLPFVGGTLDLLLVPGTYRITVETNGTAYPLGSVVLRAGDVRVLEVGRPALVFTPSGLPPATLWAVTVAGQTVTGTGNLTVGEPVGNYPYTVGPVHGFRAEPGSGTVNVTAAGGTVAIAWHAAPDNPLAALLADLVLFAPLWVLLLVVGVAVAATPPGLRRRSRAPAYRRPLPTGRFPLPGSTCPQCGATATPGIDFCAVCGFRPPGPSP